MMKIYRRDFSLCEGRVKGVSHVKKQTKNDRQENMPVVEINREWCKGCGICVALCPKEALSKDEQEKATWSHPEKCNACGACELRCPDMAIEVKREQGGLNPKTHERKHSLSPGK